MTVLGEAKSELQAYYNTVIVGVCFVLIISFYCSYLLKFRILHLGRGAADENRGLPGSCILSKYLL